MDIDATYAPGPEYVTVPSLGQGCRWLAIGIHYYTYPFRDLPHVGPVTARIQAWSGREPLLDLMLAVEPGEFHEVASVHWPTGTLFPLELVDSFDEPRRPVLSGRAHESGLCGLPDGVQCRQDEHCAEGLSCELGTCTEGCQMDADCDDGEVCERGQCLREMCLDDAGCPDGHACSAGVCLSRCEADADCPGEILCERGTCGQAPECQTDAHCGEDQRCRHTACLPWTAECGVDTDLDGVGDACDDCPLGGNGALDCFCNDDNDCTPLDAVLTDLSSAAGEVRFPGAEVDALIFVPDDMFGQPFPLIPHAAPWDWPARQEPDLTGMERTDAQCRPRQDAEGRWNVEAIGGRENGGVAVFGTPDLSQSGTFILHEIGEDQCPGRGFRTDPMLLSVGSHLGEQPVGIFEPGVTMLRWDP